jgi:hypothetical protein
MEDMPEREHPLEEQFRIVANKWCDAHAAADVLEETKTANLSQMILNYKARERQYGPVAHNTAETAVKASKEWHEFITAMVNARKDANRLKVQLEYIRMKFSKWQSVNANARQERFMSR